jgi:hypothetical protein
MALYTGDRNKVVMFFESGTYANASGTGQWMGLIQDHNIDETQDRASIRYQGADTRDVSTFVQTLIDVKGTVSYYPQDFRMLGFALGSIVDAGSPIPYTHALAEINASSPGNAYTSGTKAPFLSFGLEDSKAHVTGLNFIRTVKGAMVDSLTLSSKQGEPLSVDVNYVAQSVAFTSGASTAVTADTNRPYLWSDSSINIPSGTNFEEVTDWDLTINNNIEVPHYCNGSRVAGLPQPLNRDYELTLTYQANSQKSKTIYDSYFQGGSDFNVHIPITINAGSRFATITLSGCQVFPLAMDGSVEGIVEQKVTIIPKSCSVAVSDFILKYNPW